MYNSRLHWSSLNLIKFYYFYYFWIMVTVCVSLSDVFCLNFLLFTFYCPSFCLKHQFNFKLEMLIRFTLWILLVEHRLIVRETSYLLCLPTKVSTSSSECAHMKGGASHVDYTKWISWAAYSSQTLLEEQVAEINKEYASVKWMLQYKIIKSDELTTGLLNVLSVMPFVSNMTLQSSCR